MTEAEDRISELEDRMVEINESERIKEKQIKRNEDNLRDLQDNIKCYNIRIIGVCNTSPRETVRFLQGSQADPLYLCATPFAQPQPQNGWRG